MNHLFINGKFLGSELINPKIITLKKRKQSIPNYKAGLRFLLQITNAWANCWELRITPFLSPGLNRVQAFYPRFL